MSLYAFVCLSSLAISTQILAAAENSPSNDPVALPEAVPSQPNSGDSLSVHAPKTPNEDVLKQARPAQGAPLKPTASIRPPVAGVPQNCADELNFKLEQFTGAINNEAARVKIRNEIFVFIKKNGEKIKAGQCLPSNYSKESLCLKLCSRNKEARLGRGSDKESTLFYGQKKNASSALYTLSYSYGPDLSHGPKIIKLINNESKLTPLMFVSETGADGSPRGLVFGGGVNVYYPDNNPTSPLHNLVYMNQDKSIDFEKTCKLNWNPHAFLQMTFLQAKKAQLNNKQLSPDILASLTKEKSEGSFEQPLENNAEFYDDCVVSDSNYSDIVKTTVPQEVVKPAIIAGILPAAKDLPPMKIDESLAPFPPDVAATKQAELEKQNAAHVADVAKKAEEAKRVEAARLAEIKRQEDVREANAGVAGAVKPVEQGPTPAPAPTPEKVADRPPVLDPLPVAGDAPAPVPTADAHAAEEAQRKALDENSKKIAEDVERLARERADKERIASEEAAKHAADSLGAGGLMASVKPGSGVSPQVNPPQSTPQEPALTVINGGALPPAPGFNDPANSGETFQPTHEATRQPAVTSPSSTPLAQLPDSNAGGAPYYPQSPDAPQYHAANPADLRPEANQKPNSTGTNVLFLIGAAVLAFFLVSSIKKK
ncbi:MAG: hypothetical protein KA116_05780 [Proteobacteria bacterium]|nr:hypothetical protein [Pseudomonadota bacterium]